MSKGDFIMQGGLILSERNYSDSYTMISELFDLLEDPTSS